MPCRWRCKRLTVLGLNNRRHAGLYAGVSSRLSNRLRVLRSSRRDRRIPRVRIPDSSIQHLHPRHDHPHDPDEPADNEPEDENFHARTVAVRSDAARERTELQRRGQDDR